MVREGRTLKLKEHFKQSLCRSSNPKPQQQPNLRSEDYSSLDNSAIDAAHQMRFSQNLSHPKPDNALCQQHTVGGFRFNTAGLCGLEAQEKCLYKITAFMKPHNHESYVFDKIDGRKPGQWQIKQDDYQVSRTPEQNSYLVYRVQKYDLKTQRLYKYFGFAVQPLCSSEGKLVCGQFWLPLMAGKPPQYCANFLDACQSQCQPQSKVFLNSRISNLQDSLSDQWTPLDSILPSWAADVGDKTLNI